MIASEPLGPNRWPLNQLAKARLVEAGLSPDPGSLYLVQLLQLGFEKGLPVLGPGEAYRADLGQAAEGLDDPSYDPMKIMRWLLSNRNMESQSEQNDTLRRELENAPDWREAAQNLMQWFYSLKASEDPYYRPAPGLPRG